MKDRDGRPIKAGDKVKRSGGRKVLIVRHIQERPGPVAWCGDGEVSTFYYPYEIRLVKEHPTTTATTTTTS